MNYFGTHSISKPEIIGYYSIGDDGKYLNDSSKISYYKPRKLGAVSLDLNEGIESAVLYSENTEAHLNYLLKWIGSDKARINIFSEFDERIPPEFVCSSGLLQNVLRNPILHEDNWTIHASRWRGKIYLHRTESHQMLNYDEKAAQKFTSWSHKFSQFFQSDHPEKSPDTSRPVIEPAEFRCVFKQHIGAHSVIFSSKIDAVQSNSILNDPLPLTELKFVSLKTQQKIVEDNVVYDPRDHNKNVGKFHLLKWLIQCHLTGTEDVLCGFRNSNGIIENLTKYTIDQIFEMSKPHWNLQTCIKDGENFFNTVAERVVKECDTVIYKIKKVKGKIVIDEESLTSEAAFIPPSFLDQME